MYISLAPKRAKLSQIKNPKNKEHKLGICCLLLVKCIFIHIMILPQEVGASLNDLEDQTQK
jgi:hypothetical protein